MQAGPATVGRYRLGPRVELPGGLPVYRASDPRTGRDVALMLLPPVAADPALRRSVSLLGAVSHPNLAQVLELVEEPGVVALVHELVEVRSLEQLYKTHGPLDLLSALAVAEQLAGALEALHTHGIVHGRCEPAAIILGPDGRAVLLPPTPSNLAGSLLTTGAAAVDLMAGAPAEAAPGAPITPGTDVYLLAATTASALAGRQIAGTELPLLVAVRPDLPPTVVATLAGALHPDPSLRPPSPTAFVAGLRRAMQGPPPGTGAVLGHASPILAPPAVTTNTVGAVPRLAPAPSQSTVPEPRFTQPRRILWAAGALAGIGGLAVVGFLLARSMAGGSAPTAAVAPVIVASSTVAAPHIAGSPAIPAITPTPWATPPAVAPAPYRPLMPQPANPLDVVLLADDFSAPDRTLLPLGSSGSARWTYSIEGGEYIIRKHDPEEGRLASAYLAGTYENTALGIDVRLIGTGTGRIMALGCRVSDAGSYRLTVNFEQSEVLISRWEAGMETNLGSGWVKAPGLRTAAHWNRVEFTCAGETLSASVNGQVVATARDSTYASGRWWIGAGLFADRLPGTIEAHFDTLILLQR